MFALLLLAYTALRGENQWSREKRGKYSFGVQFVAQVLWMIAWAKFKRHDDAFSCPQSKDLRCFVSTAMGIGLLCIFLQHLYGMRYGSRREKEYWLYCQRMKIGLYQNHEPKKLVFKKVPNAYGKGEFSVSKHAKAGEPWPSRYAVTELEPSAYMIAGSHWSFKIIILAEVAVAAMGVWALLQATQHDCQALDPGLYWLSTALILCYCVVYILCCIALAMAGTRSGRRSDAS